MAPSHFTISVAALHMHGFVDSLIHQPFDFNSILARYLSCFLAIGRVYKSDRLLGKKKKKEKRNGIVQEGRGKRKSRKNCGVRAEYSIPMLFARGLPTFFTQRLETIPRVFLLINHSRARQIQTFLDKI